MHGVSTLGGKSFRNFRLAFDFQNVSERRKQQFQKRLDVYASSKVALFSKSINKFQ